MINFSSHGENPEFEFETFKQVTNFTKLCLANGYSVVVGEKLKYGE